MTLRSPELRQAYEAVRKDKAAKRKARKEAAREYVKTQVSSAMANRKDVREKDNTYLAWIRRLPCIASLVTGSCEGNTQAAHIRYSDIRYGRVNSGMQRKPSDKWTLPLCSYHHLDDQHQRNEREFWSSIGVEPGELCQSLHAAFLAGQDGEPVIRNYLSRPFPKRKADALDQG